MKEELAILVISCDRYKDVWKPFFDLFELFWPDCPYRRYLGTNFEDFSYPGVQVLKAGDDISWTDNVRKFLDQIDESHVLTFLEDFFISKPVDTGKIGKAFEFAMRERADVLSLILPKKGEPFDHKLGLFHIDPKQDYCVNTSIAIRRKEMFAAFLKPGYSAWDFEVKNSKDINAAGAFPGLFLTVGEDYFHLLNGIWRGKWVPGSVRFCRRLGIEVDTTNRVSMGFSDTFWEFIKGRSRKLMPEALRKAMKRVLVRMGFSHRFVSVD